MCRCCVSACGREISCRWGSVGVCRRLEVWRSLMAPPQTHSICLRIPLRTHTHTDCLLAAWADALKQGEWLHQRGLSSSPLGSVLKDDGIRVGGGYVILFSSFPPALVLMCVDVVQRNSPLHSVFCPLLTSLSLLLFLSEVCVGDYSVDLSGFAFSTHCHCFWFRHVFY